MGDGQSSGNKDSNQPSQSQQQGGQKEQAPDKPQGSENEPDSPPQGKDPKSGKEQPSQPQSAQVGGPPPPDPTQDPLMVSSDREQWGNLPLRMRELFRAEGQGKIPARYRDWIESYYRRLNDR